MEGAARALAPTARASCPAASNLLRPRAPPAVNMSLVHVVRRALRHSGLHRLHGIASEKNLGRRIGN